MTHTKFLFAAAAAALAVSPAYARPMTATDMHSMHRIGAPEVSPDGRTAVFTISTTDWSKNKRVNSLYTLDLTKPGAAPQPVAEFIQAIATTAPASGQQDLRLVAGLGTSPVRVIARRAPAAYGHTMPIPAPHPENL